MRTRAGCGLDRYDRPERLASAEKHLLKLSETLLDRSLLCSREDVFFNLVLINHETGLIFSSSVIYSRERTHQDVRQALMTSKFSRIAPQMRNIHS